MSVADIIRIENLTKRYEGGFVALKNINLNIKEGEIFALLGPNGAGKTTLISTICGISTATEGSVYVGGFDITRDFRKTRGLIGLVPQEIALDSFETVWQTVNFTRGLFGKPPHDSYIDDLLRKLTLSEKKNSKLITLSGGMKRRVMIAKALAHEPRVLFLDEPTAGVDVELRKEMWQQVRALKQSGVTVILTTHYIEEAEDMADRIGVINKGELILVEEKAQLMKNLGTRQLIIEPQSHLAEIPISLAGLNVRLENGNLFYTYDAKLSENGVQEVLTRLAASGVAIHEIRTKQSSLEEIFVELVRK